MARSFVYKRPLDVRILSNVENLNHEFQFNRLLEIKKEVENDSSDMDIELPPAGTTMKSSGLADDYASESQLATETHQHQECHDVPPPKLVIKFHDLWAKSEQSINFHRKSRKRNSEKKNKVPTKHNLGSNRRRIFDSSVPQKNDITQSSSLTTKPENNSGETETEFNRSQNAEASDRQEKQKVCNLGPVTRSKKDLLCESCGKCFTNNKHLQAHKRYYSVDGQYHCAICDVRFSHRFQLSRHTKVAHSPLDDGHRKFTCHHCMDHFDKKSSLIAHVTHLHNKQIVAPRKRGPASLDNTRIGRNIRAKRFRKSKKLRKNVSLPNSHDHQIISNSTSDSTQGMNTLVRNESDTDEQLRHVNSIMHVNDNYSGEKLIVDNLDCVNEKAHTNSLQHPSTVGKSEQENSMSQQQETDVQDNIDEVVLSSRSQLSENSAAVHRSRKFGGTSDQRSFDIGNLGTTVDPANRSLGVKMNNVLQCTKSSDLEMNASNGSMDITNTAPYSDQKHAETEELPAKGKNLHTTKENYISNEVRSQPDEVSEKVDLIPSDQQLHQQVDLVLLRQSSEDFDIARMNAGIDNAVSNDSIRINNFGMTRESTSINHEEYEMSDCNRESITLRMTESSPNFTSIDSISGKSHDGTMRTSCDLSKDREIKDIRVLLVKLENMPSPHMKNSSPKSPPIKKSNVVKTQKPHCNLCKKRFLKQQGLMAHYRWKHGIQKGESNRESETIRMTKRDTTNQLPKVLTNANRSRVHQKLIHGIDSKKKKRCHLCDVVFHNIFGAARHYLAVHTKMGSTRCCLCATEFNNIKELRYHLWKHYDERTSDGFQRFCIVCRKEFTIPSPETHCTNCKKNSQIEKFIPQMKLFRNARDTTKHPSADAQENVRPEVHVSENESVPQPRISSVSISEDKAKINIPIVEDEITKREETFIPPKFCEGFLGNFECSVCNRVFVESSLLEHHLLTAHADVESRRYEKCQDLVKPRILSNRMSRDRQNKPRKCYVIKNKIRKFCVGKKRNTESKSIGRHDKLCKKQSSARPRPRLSQTNSRTKHAIRNKKIRGNGKTCCDYKCDVCGLNCCCRTSLKIHKARYSTNDGNLCNICGLISARKQVLVTHMKMAHNQGIFFHGRIRCKICEQRFYNKKFLRIHLAHFHSIKYFQCKICRISFGTRRSLNIHIRIYSKDLESLCGICDQSFSCKYMLQYHKAEVHHRDELTVYKYSCDVCNYAFRDELLLQAHIGHFHNIKNCEAETNAIDRNEGETTEQLLESMEFPFKTVNVCTKLNNATNNSTIEKHAKDIHEVQEITENVVAQTIRSHTSIEYKCGICKLNFSDPYAILNHEWEFANEGKYTCHLCNRKFMTDSLLKDHMVKHYQKNVHHKYGCYICNEDFSQVDHLRMHGLHLHGPQFVWEGSSGTANIDNRNISPSQIKKDGVLETCSSDNNVDISELMESNEAPHSGRILLFQKFASNGSSIDPQLPQSNEDAHFCNFCKTNFSSSSILMHHLNNHTYRTYYTNSSKYLCLICKNKFRSNDILRAHVIHCHTSDEKARHVSKPGYSKDTFSNEPIKCQAHGHSEHTSIDNVEDRVENAVGNSTLECTSQNQVPSPKKHCGIEQSNSNQPSELRQLFQSQSKVNIIQTNQAHLTPVISQAGYKTDDSDGSENNNRLKSVEFGYSGIASGIESNMKLEEVELFAVRVDDANGLERHACNICLVSLHSITQFREHFSTIHIKNGLYLCTACGQKFLLMSDLKYHILKHEGELRHRTCCNERFLLMADFIRHKLSHNEQVEGAQNASNTQLLPLLERGSLEKSHDESNVNIITKQSDCEIYDKSFKDFNTTLEHCDSGTNNNGSDCKPRRVTSKSWNSSRMHKKTHHEQKQNSDTVISLRRSVRSDCQQSIQPSLPRSIIHDHELEGTTTIHESANQNITDRPERVVTSFDESSKPKRLLRLRKVMVKPYAQILPKKNYKEKNHIHQQRAHHAKDTTIREPEFSMKKGTQSSIGTALRTSQETSSTGTAGKRIPPKMQTYENTPFRIECYPVESIMQLNISDEQITDNFSCNAGQDHVLYHLSDNESNDVTTQYQQDQYQGKILGTLQPIFFTTAHYSRFNTTVQNSGINTVNMRIASKVCSRKFSSNDSQTKTLLNPVSVSSNNANNAPHYLSNQTVTDSCKNKFRRSSKTVSNKIRAVDIQGVTGSDSRISTHQDFGRNDPTSRSYQIYSKDLGKPILPTTASTSNSVKLSTSHTIAPENGNASMDKCISTKEFISKKQVFQCSYCKLLFTEKAKLNTHLESHNRCPICGISFSTEEALQKHVPEHKYSTCTRCNMKFSFSDSTVDPKGTQEYCSSCNELLPLPNNTRNRSRRNTPYQLMKCGICMDTFGTIAEMTAHFRLIHPSFICGICDSKFSTKTGLHNHFRTHGSSPFEECQCRTCNKYFSDISDLTIHALSH